MRQSLAIFLTTLAAGLVLILLATSANALIPCHPPKHGRHPAPKPKCHLVQVYIPARPHSMGLSVWKCLPTKGHR